MAEPETIDAEHLRSWAAAAAPGDVVCYWKGFLMCDRVKLDRNRHTPVEPVDTIGRVAWELSSAGAVALLQRRCGANEFLYLCQKLNGRTHH